MLPATTLLALGPADRRQRTRLRFENDRWSRFAEAEEARPADERTVAAA